MRQLNNYGFHKVDSKEGETFSNKYFRPNRPDLLRYIQRHKQFHNNLCCTNISYLQSTKSVIRNDYNTTTLNIPNNIPNNTNNTLNIPNNMINKTIIFNTNNQQQQQQHNHHHHQSVLLLLPHKGTSNNVKLWRRIKELRTQNETMMKTLKSIFAELESIKANDDSMIETTEKIMQAAISLAKLKGVNYSRAYSKYLFHKSTLKALGGTSNAFDASARSSDTGEDPLNLLASAAQQQQQQHHHHHQENIK